MSNQAENINTTQSSNSGSQKEMAAKVSNVIQRAKAIIMNPAATWQIIKAEPTTIKDIYQNYIAILLLVPAICNFLAMAVIGMSVPFFGTWRAPLFGTLVSQVISYAVSLAMVYVTALVIEKLAPKFEAKVDTLGAIKLVAYAATPAWVASIFNLLPGPLALLGVIAGSVYSIYVFLLGVQPMTSVPDSRKTGYVAVSALVMIVLSIIVGAMAATFTPRYDAGFNNPQAIQSEQMKQFEDSMKALQKVMPGAPK